MNCVLYFSMRNKGGPGAPPIYTIDLNSNSTPSNYTNAAYVITENPKTSHSSDGLPTYEEAMSGVRNPMAQSGGSQPQSQPQPQAPSTTIPIEMPADEAVTTTGKRGRRHHHHRHHQRHNRRPRCDGASPADSAPAINQPSTTLNAVCENGDDATHGRRARRSNYRHLRNHRRHHRNNPQNPQE